MFAPTSRLLAALPISVAEFRESLASIWLPRVRVRSPRLGLAVSGGVDSMALATLCADLSGEVSDDDDADVFTAFIVDHQLRSGSSEEAWEVREKLYKLGIAAEVLQVQWPEGTNTKSLTNLETLARRFRFRLLGQACRDHGIESLLLAHHSDDQAETVMMRLIDGHRGMGLRGMRAAGDIPECFGMHGVHQSHAEWLTNDDPRSPAETQNAVGIEFWGVQVLRPLLPFSKDRLTATCEAVGTPWVEDETNKDPTLTMRNAVRHVYQNHRLPAAISKPALLQLAQRTAKKIQAREEEVDSLLKKLDAVLDLRSGELAVRFARNFFPPTILKTPRAPEYGWPGTGKRVLYPESWSMDKEENKVVATMLIRRLANLVSPRETVDLSSLETAVRYFFPRLYLANPFDYVTGSVPSSFTAAGVLFERVQTPDANFPYYTWMLSRQPYTRGEEPTVVIPPNTPSPSLTSLPPTTTTTTTTGRDDHDNDDDDIPFLPGEEEEADNPNEVDDATPTSVPSSFEAPFTLYDGRWWLRVHNPSPAHALTVRPFRHADLKPLRAALAGPMRARFEALRVDARSKARFVLPVIVAPASSISPFLTEHNDNDGIGIEEGEGEGERLEGDEATAAAAATTSSSAGGASNAVNGNDEDVVIAVPTFGVKVNVGAAARAWRELRWEVRYKKLDGTVQARDEWEGSGGEEEDEDVPFVDDEQQQQHGTGRGGAIGR
ncbi:putative pp-loop family protein [Diplodia seriata]|uniref:tRNA(Ile)-lysidine synthetase n=1 Tax=Diplodia seriata TaxID=420778 RepID=A0A0G2GH00_9PEZI|nr:putative pp-loop family protein [Diplodia seriata]